MYDNISGKIKILAKVEFIVGSILSVIAGIALMFQSESLFLLSLLEIAAGVLLAWVASWFIYGFGELIEKTCDIARNTYGSERKSSAQSKVDDERIGKIERLRSEGLITEEEYQQAISKG